MTRNKAKTLLNLLPLVKAYADGAEIEFWHEGQQKWKKCSGNGPNFNSFNRYRIKPTSRYRRKVSKCCGSSTSKGHPNDTISDYVCHECGTGCSLVTLDVVEDSNG